MGKSFGVRQIVMGYYVSGWVSSGYENIGWGPDFWGLLEGQLTGTLTNPVTAFWISFLSL